MHDIGLVKLFAGGRTLFCVPAGMAAGYGVALAFDLPVFIGIMLGALPAFLTCLSVVDESASRVAARSAALYLPFIIALFASIALREFRILELVVIVGLLFVQFYTPGFGVWVGDFGSGLFAAYLCGLLLPLPLDSFPHVALIFAASLAVTIVVRAILFHPNAYRSLMRARRAFLAWQTRVLETCVDALEGDKRAIVAIHRRRAQTHEAALITEGLLGQPGAGSTGQAAEKLHTLLFDSEQTIDGLARLAEELAKSGAPEELCLAVSRALRTVLDQGGAGAAPAARTLLGWAADSAAVAADQRWSHAVNRTALLLSDIAVSADDWTTMRRDLPTSGDGVPFESAVVLTGGRPVGAAPILNEEIASGGMSGPWSKVRVSPTLRTAIQATVAVAITEPLAALLDGQRFYWGVIGVMVVLAGTNSTHDRLRKVGSRGAGTVIGGVIGVGFVTVLGSDHLWLSMVLVVVALTVGLYGFSRSYVVWVIALVVVLCQVYEYSDQFSDTLIVYRLAENLMGALIAVVVGLVILPVATGAMIRRAVVQQLKTIRDFVEAANNLGDGPEASSRLRKSSRAVDNATFQLESVLKPLVRFPTGGGYRKDDETRTLLIGVARTVRGIAYRGELDRPLDEAAQQVQQITDRLTVSIVELSAAIGGAGGRTWTSSVDLISELDALHSLADDNAVLSYRLHALARIDEALTGLAARYGMAIAGGAALDLTDRLALLSAGRVRHRFSNA